MRWLVFVLLAIGGAASLKAKALPDADIFILGEYHDNPEHHSAQADWLKRIRPTAVVYEMLTSDEAAALQELPRNAEAMRAGMADFHWSNIAEYSDVLAASDVIVGAAVPRQQVRAAFSEGAAPVFGAQAEAYGLHLPLDPDQLERRKQIQFDAHCQAMPMDMMGGMVEAQRLRDASFAATVLAAIEEFGSPVVLVTGNGHARKDWGVPAYLARARPDLAVYVLGQGEGGQAPPGKFDAVLDAPVPARGDPCAAFN